MLILIQQSVNRDTTVGNSRTDCVHYVIKRPINAILFMLEFTIVFIHGFTYIANNTRLICI